MILLTNEEYESYLNQTNSHICKKKFKYKYANDEEYRRIRDRCHYTGKYRGAAHDTCNLKFSIPEEILVVFQNGSNYDYYFILRDLAK